MRQLVELAQVPGGRRRPGLAPAAWGWWYTRCALRMKQVVEQRSQQECASTRLATACARRERLEMESWSRVFGNESPNVLALEA